MLVLLLITFVSGYTRVKVSPVGYVTIDPIKRPAFEHTHLHMFLATSVKSTTTNEELLSGCTNAENPNDLSAYWVPALIRKKDGKIVQPTGFAAYYFNIVKGKTKPFPPDLKLIAGDSTNQDKEPPQEVNAKWFCEDTEAVSAAFPNERCKTGMLRHYINFPNCIRPDGTNPVYAPNSWRGHAGDCPEGYHNIPMLRFSYHFDIGDMIPLRDLTLSSGTGFSSHGDFMNGWVKEAAEDMLNAIGGIQDGHLYTVKGPRKRACRPRDLASLEGHHCWTGPADKAGTTPQCHGPPLYL